MYVKEQEYFDSESLSTPLSLYSCFSSKHKFLLHFSMQPFIKIIFKKILPSTLIDDIIKAFS